MSSSSSDAQRVQEIRAREATARAALREIDEVLEYGSHEDCACGEDEGCPDCIVPMVRARLKSDVVVVEDDIAYLLARLDALEAERDAARRVLDCIDDPLFFSAEALKASPDVAALRLAAAAPGEEV